MNVKAKTERNNMRGWRQEKKGKIHANKSSLQRYPLFGSRHSFGKCIINELRLIQITLFLKTCHDQFEYEASWEMRKSS